MRRAGTFWARTIRAVGISRFMSMRIRALSRLLDAATLKLSLFRNARQGSSRGGVSRNDALSLSTQPTAACRTTFTPSRSAASKASYGHAQSEDPSEDWSFRALRDSKCDGFDAGRLAFHIGVFAEQRQLWCWSMGPERSGQVGYSPSPTSSTTGMSS
jgi:hypothetical protein